MTYSAGKEKKITFIRKKGLEPINPGSKPVLSLSREGSDLLDLDLCTGLLKSSLELLVREGGVGFVAVSDGMVVAYGGMLTVLDEGQITNVAVLPERRGEGRPP